METDTPWQLPADETGGPYTRSVGTLPYVGGSGVVAFDVTPAVRLTLAAGPALAWMQVDNDDEDAEVNPPDQVQGSSVFINLSHAEDDVSVAGHGRARGEDAVVAGEIDPRARYECGEAGHEILRREEDMGGAVAERVLELVHHLAGRNAVADRGGVQLVERVGGFQIEPGLFGILDQEANSLDSSR